MKYKFKENIFNLLKSYYSDKLIIEGHYVKTINQ